jgi:hypothetical protein
MDTTLEGNTTLIKNISIPPMISKHFTSYISWNIWMKLKKDRKMNSKKQHRKFIKPTSRELRLKPKKKRCKNTKVSLVKIKLFFTMEKR